MKKQRKDNQIKVLTKSENITNFMTCASIRALRFILVVMLIAFALVLKLSSKDVNTPYNDELRRSVSTLKMNSNWTVPKIKELYKLRNYQPIWFTSSKLNIRSENLIETFNNAKYKGLDSSEYMDAIKQTKNANWIAKEINFTAQALRYIRHVMSGRFNPKQYLEEYHRSISTYDEVKILSDLIYKNDSLANIKDLEPVSKGNLNLEKLLKAYITMKQEQRGWPKVSPGKTLGIGSKGKRVQLLKESLFLRGDLREEIINDNFDENTKSAVINFQKRHFLETDGRVGPATLRELNIPIEDRINQIIVAMERTRWFLAKSRNDKKSIQVNIPSYELTAFENNKEVLEMPIIIGRVVRKTPIFSTSIYSVRFNPSWHVPRSIIKKDKIRHFRKDPGYIKRNGYRLISMNSGKAVNPDSIDWQNMTYSKFNYRLVQRPGKLNALGKIRFSVVDSKYHVYLHSTPDKELFAKTRRNFSSGCIRVRNPVQLAKFVFDNPVKWSDGVIIKGMEGRRTRNVALPENIPMHVTYISVSFDNNGVPYFSQDKYNYDKNVWNLIKNKSKHY